MAWSWTAFNLELGRVLDDENSSNPAHTENARLDGLNAALRAMMAYRPLQLVSTYTNVSQVTVPATCYRIEALLETDGNGNTSSMAPAQVGEPDGYYVWNGIIYLPATVDTVTLYYQSYYSTVTNVTTDIPVPTWARTAVLYRTAAHCLIPNQVSRARLGAYHDRQDAGPLDNSLIQSSNWLIAEFERIMTEHKHAL